MSIKKTLALLLVLVMVVGVFAGCKPADATTTAGTTGGGEVTAKTYTYNTYTTVMPSNWNELTYQDSNDSDMIGFLGSSFMEFNYKFDEYGQIVPGEYTVQYSAATKLEDVTTQYAAAWGLGDVQTGYVWKITLREDLQWENGDPIDAEDFVYTMKQQLDPLFQNYRADSFYAGSTNLVKAKDYVKQGLSGWFAASTAYSVYSEDMDSKLVFTLGADLGAESYIRADFIGFPASYDAAAAAGYLLANYWGDLEGVNAEVLAKMEGKTLAEIKADAEMKAAWDSLIGWWQSEPNEELHFFIAEYTFPEVSFDEVGIFAESKYELVIVMTEPLALLNEDGSLSYRAAYNFSGLPLVHEATYEACKQEPVEGSTLWTSNYNSSKETSMSWGPYRIESFQNDKQFVLVKNENWFGYSSEQYEGQYQTDRYVCQKVEDWSTAWVMFQAGEVDGIGIDVSIAADYKGSSRAYYTPSSYIGSIQIQSLKEGLEARETEGVNKTILLYQDFRNAMSLAIDRAEYTTTCTTACQPAYGIFGPIHYYDVANGGVYRNTDEAKQVLCDAYNVDVSKYGGDLDKAVASITGYNLEEARKLVEKAYQAALADGEISATDKVVLTFGSSADTEAVRRHYDYLSNAWTKMCEGTSLEGRIEFEFDASFGDKWATDFRAGSYDLCMGGWQGAAWDPGYFLLAYLDDNYRYAAGWDPTTVDMTFTMKGVGENGEDITETMNLIEWYNCLNAISGCKYDWSENGIPNEQRLQLIAALEGQILQSYYSVVTYASYSASMISYKVDYISYEYNTFMGYGGIQYMTYNYDDAAWAAEVAAHNNQLEYKQ